MCETCGCGDPNVVPIEVQTNLLAKNDEIAGHNRAHFARAGVTAINVMGSPGAGKTALLEATARELGSGGKIGAVSADLATDNDARRLRAAGVVSHGITTGSACHLDARLVHHKLHEIELTGFEYFFIENVGNLVCPAIYDLGQAANVVTLAVTEGEDKPLKYPVMFRKVDLVVVTKVDLLPHLPRVNRARIEDAIRRTMAEPRILWVSAETGEGLGAWAEWLAEQRQGTGMEAAAG